ncbi:MAG TPA: glycerate kinase [Acidimicrobiia bacterium]
MLRAVVSPDKFRGSLDAMAAAAAIATGLTRGGYDEVAQVPMADGGDGTLQVLAAVLGGSWRSVTVDGPLGRPVDAGWLMLPGGTAAIEMARASGLALVAGHNDPLRASTRGTGQLIDAARTAGCRQLVVAVGGSATTDGGLAAIEALHWSLGGVDTTVACDVQTRFVDAADVYGPQKGASPAQVGLLRRRLEMLADQYEARTGVDVRVIDGAGAAGGLAGGLAALGARIEPGFDVVANAVGLDDQLEGCDLVVTGEGRLDAPSLEGKVVGGVLDAAAAAGVEYRVVICGVADRETREQLEADGVRVLTLVDRAWDRDDAYTRAALLCEEAALEAARAITT